MKKIGFKFTGGRWLAAVIGVLGIVGGARESVWANDINFRGVVRNTDFVSAGVGGLRNIGKGTITLRGMTGTVHQAWLYWAGPSNSTNPLANAAITLNSRPIVGEQIGFTSDNCWGYRNSQAYRADVTSIVAAMGNGAYAIAGLLKQGTNINANGASLLVFYNDAHAANNLDVVLFDGNDSNAPNPYDMLGWNVRLAGIQYTNGSAGIQLHVSDGQAYKDGAVIINGKPIIAAGSVFQGTSTPAPNDGPINNGALWDIKNLDVTPFLAAGTNSLQMTHNYLTSGGDCVALVVAAFNLPAGVAPPSGPELTNNAPSILADLELIIHTPKPVVVHADVSDIDGDALTTAISLDGVLMYTGTIEKSFPMTTGKLTLTNAYTLGEHSILFAASDGALAASCVMALRVIDNTPPTITVPANIIVPTDPGKPTATVIFTATATDDFPGDINIVCLPLPGSAFPIGVTTVNCSATDRSGNVGRGSFTITVTDALPPVITCPADLIHPAMRGTNVAVVTFVVAFSDNQPGATMSCVPPSGSLFLMGTNPVTCTARDAAGNTANCSFNVIIVDAEPPVIVVPPTSINGNDIGQCSAVVTYEVRVSDNMPGAVVACVPPSGSTFASGTNLVVCDAVDAAGNTASNSFIVIVRDTEKPVLNLPADVVVPCDAAKPNAVVNYTVTATDNCGPAQVTCTPASGSVFPCGTNLVRCVARDGAGNSSSGTFKVIVCDTQPPVIVSITPSKKYLWPPNHKMIPITFAVSATDNCAPLTYRITSITSNQPLNGNSDGTTAVDWQILGPLKANIRAERSPQTAPRTYTITVEAKDPAGNVSSSSATVLVTQNGK